jgi:hypothetical protein
VLEWRFFRRLGFCRVVRETPAGVAPEPLEESLTPSSAIRFCLFEDSRALVGRFFLFEARVVTYSRWSDRYLSLDESLLGNPSETRAPFEGVSCIPEAFS